MITAMEAVIVGVTSGSRKTSMIYEPDEVLVVTTATLLGPTSSVRVKPSQ
jgi:flagellar motor component MotA